MFDIYTVAFIGHRYIDNISLIEKKIEELVRNIISDKSYVEFLVGNDGEFDQIVSSTVLRVKRKNFCADSSLIWIMPYETAKYRNNEKNFKNYYDEIELCDESASAYFKNAIMIRNRYMVDRADILVCYVEQKKGGAYQTMKYAKSIGKNIINIYDEIEKDKS